MDKKVGVVLTALVLIVFLTGFVSAAQDFVQSFTNLWQQTIDIISPIASAFFGSSNVNGQAQGDVLFIKVLLFIIILTMIWAVLRTVDFFSENEWVPVIISIAVSLLTVRFLATADWVQTILLPYSALGVAITSFIPLIIYFYFIQKTVGNYDILRKIAWVLAAVIFTGIYISRVQEVPSFIETGTFNPIYIYPITALISLILFLFDKTIRRAYINAEVKAIGASDVIGLRADLRRRLAEANSDLATGIITPTEHKKIQKQLTKRLKLIDTV